MTTVITCDSNFCVYWSRGVCTLDNISLDITGGCDSCIYVDVDPDLVERERQKLLEQWEEG